MTRSGLILLVDLRSVRFSRRIDFFVDVNVQHLDEDVQVKLGEGSELVPEDDETVEGVLDVIFLCLEDVVGECIFVGGLSYFVTNISSCREHEARGKHDVKPEKKS